MNGSRRSLPVLIALALIAIALPAPAPAGRAGLPGTREFHTSDACHLCSDTLDSVPTRLDERSVERIGIRLHEENVRLLARIDSLYHRGYFGAKGSSEARREARECFGMLSMNSMDYIADLSISQGEIFETDARALSRPFFQTFSHPGVYPVQGLVRARMGAGGFCMRYDLDYPFSSERIPGLRDAQMEAINVDVDGAKTRLLRLRYPSSIHSTIDLLFREEYCGRVERMTILDRGDTLDVIVIRDIQGSYVGKGGTHRVQALVTWRGRMPHGPWKPGRSRFGAVAYFPDIHFSLPWFLPDLGLEDLREFDYPQPLLKRQGLDAFAVPEWLELRRPEMSFEDWTAHGARPALLERMFPDL